ncbi:hypothetical protein [Holospora undulata]|nr:hypothetical protein [Holospora undulata]
MLPPVFQVIVCLQGIFDEILQTNDGVERYFIQEKMFYLFPERGVYLE